jgi:hypothetical protein
MLGMPYGRWDGMGNSCLACRTRFWRLACTSTASSTPRPTPKMSAPGVAAAAAAAAPRAAGRRRPRVRPRLCRRRRRTWCRGCARLDPRRSRPRRQPDRARRPSTGAGSAANSLRCADVQRLTPLPLPRRAPRSGSRKRSVKREEDVSTFAALLVSPPALPASSPAAPSGWARALSAPDHVRDPAARAPAPCCSSVTELTVLPCTQHRKCVCPPLFSRPTLPGGATPGRTPGVRARASGEPLHLRVCPALHPPMHVCRALTSGCCRRRGGMSRWRRRRTGRRRTTRGSRRSAHGPRRPCEG